MEKARLAASASGGSVTDLRPRRRARGASVLYLDAEEDPLALAQRGRRDETPNQAQSAARRVLHPRFGGAGARVVTRGRLGPRARDWDDRRRFEGRLADEAIRDARRPTRPASSRR